MNITVPGDKSITQRALILAALADGTSRVAGLLPGADPRSTAGALRALGAAIPPLPADGASIEIAGRGLRGLAPPAEPLDLGNSGTGARLLLGVLAGQPFSATVTGDASLVSRPMARVTAPLASMGARFEELGEPGRLPLRVHGGRLEPVDRDLPVASAQVKSALLLAGLTGGAFVLLTEPGRSRDHTERMLRQVGVSILGHAVAGGWRVEMRDPPGSIRPLDDFRVPGDLSSAAFLLVLGALGGAGEGLTVEGVGLNPTRSGILPALERMGVRLDVDGPGPARAGSGGDAVGEPAGSITVRPGALSAAEIGAADVVAAIDEIPVLAVAAARAEGLTRITGASELRVKETDRIHALARNLEALGVDVAELDDGLEIEGSDRPLTGSVRAFDDHRIAMAFGVLGALPGNDIEVVGRECVDVSYPGFWDDLARIAQGARGGSAAGIRAAPGTPRGSASARGRDPVVTLDGPAGSGKSTTAKEVARRLGFRHLDSGAFYRALTFALLDAGIEPARWADLTEADLDERDVSIEPAREGFRIMVGDRELGDELRSPEVTARVSELARLPAVRDWLLDIQRRAGAWGGLVADGRDMGTVVFPDARVKVFLTADLEERARRRLLEHGASDPTSAELADEVRRIAERDRMDSERERSPLRRPQDAHVLDTSRLDFEEQVEAIVSLVRGAGPAP